MGCDIHSRAERRVDGSWQIIPDLHPFDWRSYGMYGFLADVRNYSKVPPLAPPRGVPEDSPRNDDDRQGLGDHSFSWLSLEELLSFNYDAIFEDRRVTRQIDHNLISGAVTADQGEGEQVSFRDFLGEAFFNDLEKLKAAGAERVVFGFDN
jgi:hypothetical protein